MFTLYKKDKQTKARLGEIRTAHGCIKTPFFMPVGTNGTVKSLTFEDLKEAQAQLVLSNTYHLYLRPGLEIIEKAGGLHEYMGWDKPILTDSGGYQVFSLTKLRKLNEDGVQFQSHLDGSKHFFTPEKVIEIEQILGSDMIMPLDVCAPYPCREREAETAVRSTTHWAQRSKAFFHNHPAKKEQRLFGIIQGSSYKKLRERSAEEILKIGFDGYAIGGVSVGEPVDEMFQVLDWVAPLLPEDKPRYFMGIGLPDQIVKAVSEGVDMFDTCIPTRYGRHGTAFTMDGPVNLNKEEFEKDLRPLDETCDNVYSQKYSRSYIRHLIKSHEITGLKILSYHNIFFYVSLMKNIRQAIEEDRYEDFQKDFLCRYGSSLEVPEEV